MLHPGKTLDLLMLVFLVCEANSTCTTETNPLTLDPPEVIGRYDDIVMVNCTTSYDFHDKMYWKVGQADPIEEEEISFVTLPLTLSNWSLNAKCNININDSIECSKNLEITVYKLPDVVSVVGPDVMVEGTEYPLVCDIINVTPLQNLNVKWYRGNETVHTQIVSGTSVTPVNVSLTLMVTAGRDLGGAHFRCEVELIFGANGPEFIPTATSSPYTAAVHYKPLLRDCSGHYTGMEHEFRTGMLSCRADGNPLPTVQWYYQGELINASEPLTRSDSGEYMVEAVNTVGTSRTSVNITIEYAPEFNNNTEKVLVYEGTDVNLTCDAVGRPTPVLKWTCDGANMWENTTILNITQVKTSATYECTAINHLGNKTKRIHVEMIKTNMAATTAAMTSPEASTQAGCPLIMVPSEVVVRFGDPVSINCSSLDTDNFGMGWESPLGGTEFQNHSAVTWTVKELNMWGIEPKCYVTLKLKQCTVMPNITLYKLPDVVSVVGPNVMVEGTEYPLVCDIINVTPLQNLKVKWYRGNETVHTQMVSGTSVTPVNVSLTLMVTAGRDLAGAHFRCEVQLHLGPNGPESIPTVTSSPYTAAVHYKPLFRDCSGHYTGLEHEFMLWNLSCQADGNPTPTVRWYYKEELIIASQPLNRSHSGEYRIEAENGFGESSTFVNITVEYGPSFTCNQRYEVRDDDELQTTCKPVGTPQPYVTWTKDGVEIVTPHRWTKHDSGNYMLQATNKHGKANHMLYLDVLYTPVFTSENYTTKVTPGQNITFECSAEGNPSPDIRWSYTSAGNVMETTGGLQRSISVTGATSTNAGVYVCVAVNKVGRVSRSVTLIMKGETRDVPLGVYCVVPMLLVMIMVAIVIVTLHNRKKKHGQYNVVPVNANDISKEYIPINNMSESVKT